MDIPGGRISKAPKATFSKQDSRYNPTPEEQSMSQMMEDLGDHRITNLPLSGARVLGTAPAPNPGKGGAQNSQMTLESGHTEAWAALFDPSLVIERNDGLGEGQSYRLGPNYLPIADPKSKSPPKGYRYRPGSDPGLGRPPTPRLLPGPPGPRVTSDTPALPSDRGQTIPSPIPRGGLQIRSDLNEVTPTASQHQRKAFRGRAAGNGIPPKKAIPTATSIPPFVPLSSLAHLSSLDSSRGTRKVPDRKVLDRKVPDNPNVNHWHTGNLITANQDFYDYIQPKTGTNKSTDPLTPKMETGESRNIQLALKPNTTTTNAPGKTDSPKSTGDACNEIELGKFAEAAPETIPRTNGAEAGRKLASQTVVVVVEGEKIGDQETGGIAQVASQLAPKSSSDSGKNLSAVPDAGSLESRKNNNPESQPHINLQAAFESLENEMQLTTRALLGCSFDSHDYEIKEIFNKTRLKALADKINAVDKLLSEEITKIYQFKTSLQDIKSRSKKMADNFLKMKMEHDELMAKRKRIAEMEADKKAAEQFHQKSRLEKQRQVELQREKLLQEEQRLEEKQRLEKQRQEGKRREEKQREEKRQDEERQGEKRQEELQEETHRQEERREGERQGEKRQEEKCREDHRQEEPRKEKLRLEAERLEEQRSERRRREKQRIEKLQEEPLLEDDQPQKEKQRGLDRLRYEKQQLIEKQRLDKLLNDERIKAEQMGVRRLAVQRMEGQLAGEPQERKRTQNEVEKILTRESPDGGKKLEINGLDEYPDPYGRGRIEAENAHEKFREITQVRAGHSTGGSSSQTSLKDVPHTADAHPAAQGAREMAAPKESGDLDNGKPNPPLFPYKLHLQLTPLFNIPSITAWVGRSSDPTVEIEKAIRQHLSEDEMGVLKKVEAYKQFLTRATDHHTRKLAKNSK